MVPPTETEINDESHKSKTFAKIPQLVGEQWCEVDQLLSGRSRPLHSFIVYIYFALERKCDQKF